MTSQPNIELPQACIECLRNRYASGREQRVVEAAGPYLLARAAEAAGDELVELVEPSEQVNKVVWNAIGEERVFLGAVLFCAREIGQDKCRDWQYSLQAQEIVPRDLSTG